MAAGTVSRAINDHPLINAETRERVLEVARRLNYQPNQHARALATNRSYLIGVVVPDLMHSYFAEICRGVEAVAEGRSKQVAQQTAAAEAIATMEAMPLPVPAESAERDNVAAESAEAPST